MGCSERTVNCVVINCNVLNEMVCFNEDTANF